ncbi:MAG: phosphoenolpyruvate--protein phosphotransferase [Candidatus Cloacimonetes bacterium]|nr:phosphoenolpyruvate--protein phosphotransferase [Candidatus Cloacimonadota bacterium]
MTILKCQTASPGIAIGNASLIRQEEFRIPTKKIREHEIETELSRFNDCTNKLITDIDSMISNFEHSQDNKDILETHKMILTDPELEHKISSRIKNDLSGLEHAISEHFEEVVGFFQKMDNEYLSLRSSDYRDVASRMLRHLLKLDDKRFEKLTENSIVIMKDITPSMVTKIFEKKVRGLCIEKGSKNSHSAIIARSLSIPMLINCQELVKKIHQDQTLIIDGHNAELIITPGKKLLEKFSKMQNEELEKQQILLKILNVQTKTVDGKPITLMSNIEIPEEILPVLANKSEGIGLFRTEFLFLGKTEFPDENEQAKIYREIAEKIAPNPLIIRTIDIGGDKLSELLNITNEENPNLGCRGIRLSFENMKIFKTQIRAILKANTKGNVKIMFPMITSVWEIEKAKKIVRKCYSEMNCKNAEIPIGAMIEIPSAALSSEQIARECDFLSIGTNDLIQYTLAVDRDNHHVSDYYDPFHPAILQLIKLTIDSAHKAGIKTAVCGELASNKEFLPLLIGFGIDELSVSPGKMLQIKKQILEQDYQAAEKIALKCLKAKNSKNIQRILKSYNPI